jgi:hypothetical protein
MKKLFKQLKKKKSIVGLKIGFFGRYEKRLRNKKVWRDIGVIAPTNINTPLSSQNFALLLKQGLCGVKMFILFKTYQNEIFKKKAFNVKFCPIK